jgi:hypothetical protein
VRIYGTATLKKQATEDVGVRFYSSVLCGKRSNPSDRPKWIQDIALVQYIERATNEHINNTQGTYMIAASSSVRYVVFGLL